jgi:dihydroneopterin aldolase
LITIQLQQLQFHAYHGLYAIEQERGGAFEVNLTATYQPQAFIQTIDQTVDYVNIYELIKQRMAIATPLLETVVMELAHQILAQFSLLEEVRISITKLHPPIPDFTGTVGVNFELKRADIKP